MLLFSRWRLRRCSAFPQAVRYSLARAALFRAAKAPPITARRLQRSVQEEIDEFNRLAQKQWVIVSSVSVDLSRWRSVARVRSTQIRFGAAVSRKFDQSGIAERVKSLYPDDPGNGYSPITLHVAARRRDEALERAIDAVDLLRGFWNFTLNRRVGWRISSMRTPINKFRLGPVHSLHDTSGKLVDETFWYEPTFPRACVATRLTERERELTLKEQAHFQRHLRDSHYRNDLEGIFIRYARALDSVDFESAALKLWSILEDLTATGRDRYDITVRRALFLYRERKIERQFLETLRYFRNRHVHYGEESAGSETLLFQLKRFVEDLLLFHLKASRELRSLQEAGDFLDKPTTLKVLRQQRRSIEQAIRFQTEGGTRWKRLRSR